MARGKTSPDSTAGSFAPAANPRSRVEPDLAGDAEAREQERVDRLWNGNDAPHASAWPYTKAGVGKLRAEFAAVGAPTFAIRYDLDIRFDPMNKADDAGVAAYCQRWLDNLEATRGVEERANQIVLVAMREAEESAAPAPASVADDGVYAALHVFEVGYDSTVEVSRSGDGFKVTRFDDGIGAEHGGDFFGADGTVFDTEDAALAAAQGWANSLGGL